MIFIFVIFSIWSCSQYLRVTCRYDVWSLDILQSLLKTREQNTGHNRRTLTDEPLAISATLIFAQGTTTTNLLLVKLGSFCTIENTGYIHETVQIFKFSGCLHTVVDIIKVVVLIVVVVIVTVIAIALSYFIV